LESDLTTPLAYFLSRPEMNCGHFDAGGCSIPRRVLKKPATPCSASNRARRRGAVHGATYEPARFPCSWSTAFVQPHDLDGNVQATFAARPEIRDRYQILVLSVSEGQAVLAERGSTAPRSPPRARDARSDAPGTGARSDGFLIGSQHGRLVSQLQTIQSGRRLLAARQQQPFSQIKADEKAKKRLEETYFFQPSPSIRRVVMIGTPHRGCSIRIGRRSGFSAR